MKIIELTQAEFSAYTDNFENVHYTQISGMEKIIELRGDTYSYIGLQDDKGSLRGATIAVEINLTIGKSLKVELSPLNTALSNSDITKEWIIQLKKYAKRKGYLDLYFIPDLPRKIISNDQEEILNNDLIDLLVNESFDHISHDQGIDPRYDNWAYKKDLTGLDSDSLWDSYANNARHSITRAEKYGIKIRELGLAELEKFKLVSEATAERIGYQDKSIEYYRTVYENGKNHVKFLVAEVDFHVYRNNLLQIKNDLSKKLEEINLHLRDFPNSKKKINQKNEYSSQLEAQELRVEEADQWIGESDQGSKTVLAGAMFLYTQETVYYLLSGSLEQYNKLNAPFLIQHNVMSEAVEKGTKTYNMLGIDGDFSGSDSIFEFKKSFNGYAEQKIGLFHWIAQPLKYKIINGLKRIFGRI